MAITAAQLQVKVTADTKDAESALGRVGSSAGSASGGIKSLLGNMLSIAGGVGVVSLAKDAFGFLKDQITESVQAAGAYQQVQAQTAAALKSTNDASGQTANSVANLADKLSTLTPFSRDATQSAENMLLTFTNLKGNVFPQAAQTTLDFAQAMHMDATSAALQLGKALNDPATGLTKLQREGVTFTEQQKEQIKAMEASGNMAGAQSIMLQELQKEFGGSAQAAGNTFAGALQIAQNQLDDTKQKIGAALIPILAQLLKAITPLISALGDGLGRVLPIVTSFITNNLVPAIQPLLSQLPRLLSFISGLGDSVSGILPTLAGLGKWFVNEGLPAAKQFADFFVANVLPVLSTLASTVIQDVLPAIKSMADTVLKQVLPAVEGLWNELEPKLVPILQFLAGVLTAVLPIAFGILANGIALAVNGLTGLIDVIGHVLGAVGWIKDKFSDVFGSLWNISKAPLNLLITGINTLIDGLDHIHFQIPGWVPGVGGNNFGISIPHIPLLANGGTATSEGSAIVGERGPELISMPRGASVIPLPSGLSPAYGNSSAIQGGVQQPVNLYVDGRLLAQIVAKNMGTVVRNATGARSF